MTTVHGICSASCSQRHRPANVAEPVCQGRASALCGQQALARHNQQSPLVLRVYARHQPSVLSIVIIVLQQELSCLFVQSRLWKRLDKQASDHQEHVSQSHVWGPVFLEDVHTDLAGFRDVWVEDFGYEVP